MCCVATRTSVPATTTPRPPACYEDLGLLTSNSAVGEDVSKLFNVLTGYSLNTDYERLLVAPHSVRNGLIERIDKEIENHRDGKPSGVRFKVNSIVDEATIDALYRASRAGVPVDVSCAGSAPSRLECEGLSENIRVRSMLGRFLEHSRIYWFAGGGTPRSMDRQRRPHAPQPRPSRRGAGSHHR